MTPCGVGRRSGAERYRTQLTNPKVKLNGKANGKDMVSYLYFDGFKIKDNRSPGTSGITFDAPTATFHQDNAYTSSPLHGLFKLADDRVIRPERIYDRDELVMLWRTIAR